MTPFPIDAVITWVDGKDPAHAARMRSYGGKFTFADDDMAGSTRYASDGEIYRCVASIRRFAPFIRTIFIVTDAQDPGIPEGGVPVKVIDHKEIFRGYEGHLPVFNSIAIETMTWRIPGLAEHYVEFNDDFMLCSPVKREDFFSAEGVPVCYCDRGPLWSVPVTRFTRAIKPSLHGRRKVTFKGMMLNGAVLAGSRWTMLKLHHTPRPLLRSFFEKYFLEHPESVLRNISCRFRDASQFSPEELQYISLYRQKTLELRPVRGNLFYFEPKDRRGYFQRKFALLGQGSHKFCCFNSLDKAPAAERQALLVWADSRILG